jgi:hypothetical protein
MSATTMRLQSDAAIQHRDKAAHLLVYYFGLLARKAGVNWNSDNETEIEIAVDHIAHAIAAEVASQIEQHREEAPHIYADGSTS